MQDQPICLNIPGLGNSTAGHWQTVWEETRDDCRRVELGHWHAPVRDQWIARIDAAVSFSRRPVVLAAHSLGCIAVAWWASEAPGPHLERVRGVLLVAPPDLERGDAPPAVTAFAPIPRDRLPWPAIVVASSNDPFAPLARAEAMARAWGAEFVDAGAHGHMNAAAGLGAWPAGQKLLDRLMRKDPLPVGAGRR